MSTIPTKPRSTPLHWGYPLAVLTAVLTLGGAYVWLTDGPTPEQHTADSLRTTAAPTPIRHLPTPPVPEAFANYKFHSVIVAEENGTQIVKLRLAEEGDEIIVDAASGKFIEMRPYRPMTVAPPMGKLAAPFAPMM
jgi:hypothetical protein